jgi:hypothetical protein
VDFFWDIALERHFDSLYVRLQRGDILRSRSICRRALAKLAHVRVISELAGHQVPIQTHRSSKPDDGSPQARGSRDLLPG